MADLRETSLTRGRPLPLPSVDNRPFYEGTRRGELRLQRCRDCRSWRHYPRPVCPRCQSQHFAWERASGRGRVHTWTIVHGPTLPAFRDELPYNVVDVELDEGVHFQSQLLDCGPGQIEAGMPVEAVFVEASPEITLVKFRPARPPRAPGPGAKPRVRARRARS